MVLFRPVFITLTRDHALHPSLGNDRRHKDVNDRKGADDDGTDNVQYDGDKRG